MPKPLHIPPPELSNQWPMEIQIEADAYRVYSPMDEMILEGIQRPIILVLPLPVSANRYWRHYRGITTRSSEAKEYIEAVQWICKAAGVEPLTGDIRTIVHIYRDNARRDLNNCTKVLYDALQGFCYLDDNQICEERHIRDYDARNPRAVVFIAADGAPADLGKMKPRRGKKTS